MTKLEKILLIIFDEIKRLNNCFVGGIFDRNATTIKHSQLNKIDYSVNFLQKFY